MEISKYASQINMDLYYYKHMHQRQPEKIFISHNLWSMLVADDNSPIRYTAKSGICYNGIPVLIYMSGRLEYYLASSGYAFDDEEE